jgi:hypothetical protein
MTKGTTKALAFASLVSPCAAACGARTASSDAEERASRTSRLDHNSPNMPASIFASGAICTAVRAMCVLLPC